jgi:hypothetical protein
VEQRRLSPARCGWTKRQIGCEPVRILRDGPGGPSDGEVVGKALNCASCRSSAAWPTARGRAQPVARRTECACTINRELARKGETSCEVFAVGLHGRLDLFAQRLVMQ